MRTAELVSVLLTGAAYSCSFSTVGVLADGTVKQEGHRAVDGGTSKLLQGNLGEGVRQGGRKPEWRVEIDALHSGKPGFNVEGKQGANTAGSQHGTPLLTFTSTNNYPPITWSPWSHLAEPFREATLKADSSIGDSSKDTFTWFFPEEDGLVFEGREVKHTFKSLGRKSVILTQTVHDTGKNYHLHGYVMVKYVRREMRQLFDVDREAFLDALETLYRVPTSEGNRIYGDEYKGIDFFVQMHLDGAGVKDCDHWHDDAGIMTHHVGYTLQFEQALQLVDPSVSIPYWEYTIEAAMGLDSYGDSVLFHEDWFGEASPGNPMHTISKGRWAYVPIMENAWDYVHNPYGLLRTPWNVDSTPYMMRHNLTSGSVATDLVSCEMYSKCFTATDMSSINNCLNGGTHGPVHILLGGQWNDPMQGFIAKTGYYESTPLVTKFLWRKGYLRIPEMCEVPKDGRSTSTCTTSCPSYLYESRGMSPYDVLVDVHALYWEAAFTGGIVRYNSEKDEFYVMGHEDDEEFTRAFWRKMLDSYCEPGHLGEMYTSSAPYDPIFWVIHPSADRFLAWRRMLARYQSDEWALDEEWGYTHGNVVGETGTVCDWSEVRPGTLDMPTCVAGICGGHNVNDILPFEIKINGEVVKMSNKEWYDFIYPENEDMPYMYNEFRWDHCQSEGYDMGTE